MLHEIAELVFDSRCVPWLVLMCERAMTDPEPQLRAAAMTLTWHLSKHLPNAFLGNASEGSRSARKLKPNDAAFAEVYLLQCKLLPVATRLSEDQSSSVRLAVAAQCDRLCDALGHHWHAVIIDMLQALLGDTDERVRREAILCVPRLSEIVLIAQRDSATAPVSVLEALLPICCRLKKDDSLEVRVALAAAAGELLTLLVGLESTKTEESESNPRSHQKYVDETLIPLLQELLNDAEPEVTSAALRAVSNASRNEKSEKVVVPLLSEDQVIRLLPTLSTLSASKQWRVRQAAVDTVPAILECAPKQETKAEIAELCSKLMNDKVDAVRLRAAECLCLGGRGLSNDATFEWINAIVLPCIRQCSDSAIVKQRLLAFKMIEVLHANITFPSRVDSDKENSSLGNNLLDIAINLKDDPVANVRLNFGRMVMGLRKFVNDESRELLIQALNGQLDQEISRGEKADRDVLFFAKQALDSMRIEEAACL